MRRKAVRVIGWFTEAQRRQIVINDEYAANLRVEEAEKAAKKVEVATRGCGGRRGKGKEKAYGGATTRSKSARPRAESIAQLVISPKKKKKTQRCVRPSEQLQYTPNKKSDYICNK